MEHIFESFFWSLKIRNKNLCDVLYYISVCMSLFPSKSTASLLEPEHWTACSVYSRNYIGWATEYGSMLYKAEGMEDSH